MQEGQELRQLQLSLSGGKNLQAETNVESYNGSSWTEVK